MREEKEQERLKKIREIKAAERQANTVNKEEQKQKWVRCSFACVQKRKPRNYMESYYWCRFIELQRKYMSTVCFESPVEPNKKTEIVIKFTSVGRYAA